MTWRIGGTIRIAAAVAALALPAAGAAAQSLTSVRGLGYPLLPVDARSEIMGGLGIGLQGFGIPMTDPAAPAGVIRRGFVLAVENTSRQMDLGETGDVSSATRFPLLRMIFPLRQVVLTVGYGAFLDQSWGVSTSGSLPLGSGGAVSYSDLVESTGGVGQFQVGAALPLGEDFAVGATVGGLIGNQRVRLVRRFDTTAVAGFEPFDEAYGWRYSGLTASAGANARVGRVAQLGASVTWSGTVTADSVEGRAVGREFEAPLQVAGGASAYLGPRLLAAVSTRWSGWSAASPEGAAGGVVGVGDVIDARDTWEVGAGLELDSPESRRTRTFPVRVGFQYRQLPFTFLEDQPTEWLVGAGVGMRMGTSPENPIALVDLAVQRGARSAAGTAALGDFRESVWRVALTLSLFGN
ncbi:MAG TPA: hypothetical protein VMM12_05265 [Longimicrobiales bacterium]|nr:hypothetical protein [Longimicrobiales bacterium]